MGEFFIGVLFTLIGSIAFAYNINWDAGGWKESLTLGEKLCAEHQGLVSLDVGGEFVCADGVSILSKQVSK